MKFGLRKRIFLGQVLLIVFPLSLITLINSYQSETILKNKAQEMIGLTCDAINEQYDRFVSDLDTTSKEIIVNRDIQNALLRDVDSVKAEGYVNLQQQLGVESYLQEIHFYKMGIHSILVHGFNGMNFCYVPGSSWNNYYDSSREDWYQDTIKNKGTLLITGVRHEEQLISYSSNNNRVITLARLIWDMTSFKPIGILQINIDPDYLASVGKEAANKGNITLFDKENNVIMSNWGNEEEALEVERISSVSGWRIVYYAPLADLVKEIREARTFSWILLGAVIFLGIVFAVLLTGSIVRPIRRLEEQMLIVSEGDFSGNIEYTQNDEMGKLIRHFNQMTQKIQSLVHDIQRKEEQRRRTEIASLQARINPHFMYNTLNTIRLTAMLHKDNEIANQVTALVYLLKNASKNGENAYSIAEELQMIESYCALMKYRYENFEVKIEGEKEVSDYLILPFTIQPIVENAIFHGIAALKEQGVIRIVFRLEKGKIELEISDNGVGMDDEMIQKIWNKDEQSKSTMNHVGMRNVIDRLKLYFGEEASMEITSKPNEGTTVVLSWDALHC